MSIVQYDNYPKVLKVIDLIGQGRTLTSACDAEHIGVATFKKYVAQSPELEVMLDEAVQRGYDAMAEALVEIDRHEHYGHSDPKMAAVVSKNIMWFLEKRRPKDYGARVAVDVNITADRAITDALTRAKQRALASTPAPAVIDVTPVHVMPAVTEDDDAAILREIGLQP